MIRWLFCLCFSLFSTIVHQLFDDKEKRFFKESAMESTLELPDIFFLSAFLDFDEEDDDDDAIESSEGAAGD